MLSSATYNVAGYLEYRLQLVAHQTCSRVLNAAERAERVFLGKLYSHFREVSIRSTVGRRFGGISAQATLRLIPSSSRETRSMTFRDAPAYVGRSASQHWTPRERVRDVG